MLMGAKNRYSFTDRSKLVLSEEAYNAFIDKVEDGEQKLFFDLMFYAGLRAGEAFALTPKDVRYQNRVSVNKTCTDDGRFCPVKAVSEHRVVVLEQPVYDRLKELADGREAHEKIFNVFKCEEVIRKAYSEAGIERITVHTFRHSYLVRNMVERA